MRSGILLAGGHGVLLGCRPYEMASFLVGGPRDRLCLLVL